MLSGFSVQVYWHIIRLFRRCEITENTSEDVSELFQHFESLLACHFRRLGCAARTLPAYLRSVIKVYAKGIPE